MESHKTFLTPFSPKKMLIVGLGIVLVITGIVLVMRNTSPIVDVKGVPVSGAKVQKLDSLTAAIRAGETKSVVLRFHGSATTLVPHNSFVARGHMIVRCAAGYIKIMPEKKDEVARTSGGDTVYLSNFDLSHGITIFGSDRKRPVLIVNTVGVIEEPPIPEDLRVQPLQGSPTGDLDGTFSISCSDDFEGSIGGWTAFVLK